MKNLIKISLVVTLVFAGYACTDLEEELQGDFTESFEPSNPGFGASQNTNKPVPDDGLNAAYSTLRNGTANHNSYFSTQEVSTDEMVITQKGGDWFDGGIWLNMHRHEFTPTGIGGIEGAWNDNYGGVSQCNILLDGELSVEGRAMVRALRAFFFWRLMDSFGNVPLPLSQGDDPDQSTRAEAFDLIESELLAAIPDLPTSKIYGRINRYGAYGILARLYLNAEVYTGTAHWQECIDACDAIINDGVYDLDGNYASVFAPDNVDNPEHIFIVPFDEATGQNMNFGQMTGHYGTQLSFDFRDQPWNGYSTLEEFYNSYADGDDRKDNNFLVGPQFDTNGNPILDLAFDQDDPDGAPLNFTPAINELAPNGSRQAGARLGKFSHKIGQQPNMDNDYTLVRYGGILMMKAEAVARRDGNWSNGETLGLVNQIRDRANATTYASLDADEFLSELGREFFQESFRRQDLIRFGAWGNAWWEKPAHGDAFKDIFPIHQNSINASTKLSQNPGY